MPGPFQALTTVIPMQTISPSSTTPGNVWFDGTHLHMNIGGNNYQIDNQSNNVTQLIGTGAAPTFTLGAAASGGTISNISTGLSGLVTITSPTSVLSSGVMVTLTFSAYPNGSIGVITPGNSATTGIGIYVSSTSTTTVVVSCTTALALSTTYKFYYTITGW